MKQISNKVNIPTLGKDNDIDIAQSVRNLMRRDDIKQHEINVLDIRLDKVRMSMNKQFNDMRILIKLLAIGLLVSDIAIIAVYLIK
jgi:hypothetical protein|nr:MAG TPA: hypothetical protein [Caudoviricetes sp.]